MVSVGSLNGSSVSNSDTQGVVQLDLGQFLQRRKGLILLGFIVGIVLAGIYLAIAQTVYVSDAKILVIPKDSKLTTSSNSEFGFESTVGDELLATHMQIISSPKVVSSALEVGDLFELDSLTAKVSGDEFATAEMRKSAVVDYIIDHLTVQRGGEGAQRDAQVLEVAFRHTSDEDSSEILMAIIGSYQDFLGETIQGAGLEAATLIENAGNNLDEKLKSQDAAYKTFLKNAPMLWATGNNLNPHQVRLTQLEAERANVQVKRAEAQSRLQLTREAVRSSSSGNLDPLAKLTVFDGADIERLSLLIQLDRGYPVSESFEARRPERAEAASAKYQQLLTLEVQQRADALRYGENHPKAKETTEKILELKSALASDSAEANVFAGDLEAPGLDLDRLIILYERMLANDVSDLGSREQQLSQLVENEKAGAKDLITFELDESSLKREMDRTQGLYDAVVDRLREINLLKDYGGYITEVISPVKLGKKDWPSIPLVLLLGSCFGLLSGTVIAVATELADRSFRSPKEIESELGVPILTHVPALSDASLNGEALAGIATSIVTVHAPKSRHSEAFRDLRTSVFFKTQSLPNPVIQITSPNAGDGKSTIISNLAVSISQANKRVLLVDCDLRRPTIHKIFGLGEKEGMSELLAGKASLHDVLSLCPSIPGLSVIAAGAVPANPSELLSLPEFVEFLEKAREEFDYVFVDSPPVTPVSDPLIIASAADLILVGITLGKDSRPIVSHCCEKLSQNGGNIGGIVVNRAQGKNSGYGYGGDYSSRYGDYGYRERTANDSYYN